MQNQSELRSLIKAAERERDSHGRFAAGGAGGAKESGYDQAVRHKGEDEGLRAKQYKEQDELDAKQKAEGRGPDKLAGHIAEIKALQNKHRAEYKEQGKRHAKERKG